MSHDAAQDFQDLLFESSAAQTGQIKRSAYRKREVKVSPVCRGDSAQTDWIVELEAVAFLLLSSASMR